MRVPVPSSVDRSAPFQLHCWLSHTSNGSPSTAQVRPELAEAGRETVAQERQKIGSAQGIGAEEIFSSTKHILGSLQKGHKSRGQNPACVCSLCFWNNPLEINRVSHLSPSVLHLVAWQMPNHHTLYGKTQNKIQSLISPLVLFRNVPQSLALFMPQACVEAQEELGTDLLSAGFSHQDQRRGGQGTGCIWWSSFMFMQTRWVRLVIICCWHPSAAKKPLLTSQSWCSRHCSLYSQRQSQPGQEMGREMGVALLKVTEHIGLHLELPRGSSKLIKQPLILLLSLSSSLLMRMWATAS